MRCVHKGSFGNGPIRRNSASSKGLAPPHGCRDANTNTQENTNTYTHTSGPITRNGSSSRGLAAPPMATIAKAHCSLQSGVYFECSEQIMQKLYLTLFYFLLGLDTFCFSCFGHCPDLKMTGETPEVRSDKMKQREKRGERDKREKRERKGEKKM